MTDLKRILYVEDEPDIQELVKIALCELGGFELLVCSSGTDAIARVVNFSPDLFLLDVMMPGMNGPDTLKALKAIPELDTIPAIFMTAKVQTDEINELKKMGAMGVIAKPFNPVTLADDIKEIYRAHSNE
ncbi:MAG: response regulator [Gammaproteobacteria bacterium]|nr:response regulator [Gammaproteobacteria bacterium]